MLVLINPKRKYTHLNSKIINLLSEVLHLKAAISQHTCHVSNIVVFQPAIMKMPAEKGVKKHDDGQP